MGVGEIKKQMAEAIQSLEGKKMLSLFFTDDVLLLYVGCEDIIRT